MRVCLPLVASLTLALSSPASANPFDDLTKGGGDACFHRIYDAEHLARNPRQNTTSMTLWITSAAIASGNAGLALTRRPDPSPVYLAASCDWEEYKPGQSSWMESYKKQAGAGCLTLAVPDVFEASSAEEGNGILLDPGPGGQTVTVHLQDPQTMVKRSDRGRKLTIKLGKDDRIFLLRRTDLRHCARIKDAVTTPEPGVKRR